ncbi:hypothetical protein JTE90_024382 [Oedothorax gibbosus]|uniref:Uncharacterized protein n=1 Tax=Oedothorax gibbosus TaxID=931172 RepID=A0AAV6TS45_9ARAC|nr:hypothetical protein JTE90_024382 [Oedothorax gibbosus]
MKITHLKSQQACIKCITQKPPPSVEQYLHHPLDEETAGPSTFEVPVPEASNSNRKNIFTEYMQELAMLWYFQPKMQGKPSTTSSRLFTKLNN